MSISRRAEHSQTMAQESVWLPDEVWMSIMYALLPQDRFSMRAVNKYFKRLAEARGSWDQAFLTTAEVIDIENLIKNKLLQQLENKNITVEKYQEAIKQLNEAKKKTIISQQDYESIKISSKSKINNLFSDAFSKFDFHSKKPFINSFLSLISAATLFICIFKSYGKNNIEDISNYCDKISNECQQELNSALKKLLINFFISGTTFGFGLKFSEGCLFENILLKKTLSFLTDENSNFSFSGKCKSVAIKGFITRDYIMFCLSLLCSIALYGINPLQLDVSQYALPDSNKTTTRLETDIS